MFTLDAWLERTPPFAADRRQRLTPRHRPVAGRRSAPPVRIRHDRAGRMLRTTLPEIRTWNDSRAHTGSMSGRAYRVPAQSAARLTVRSFGDVSVPARTARDQWSTTPTRRPVPKPPAHWLDPKRSGPPQGPWYCATTIVAL